MTTKVLGFARAIQATPTPPVNTQMLWYNTSPGAEGIYYYDIIMLMWIKLSASSGSGVLYIPLVQTAPNLYTGTISNPAISSWTTGTLYVVSMNTANTGPVQISVNAITAIALNDSTGNPLNAGDIGNDQWAVISFDGTALRAIGGIGGSGSALAPGTVVDSTLHWDGTNWVENTSFRTNSTYTTLDSTGSTFDFRTGTARNLIQENVFGHSQTVFDIPGSTFGQNGIASNNVNTLASTSPFNSSANYTQHNISIPQSQIYSQATNSFISQTNTSPTAAYFASISPSQNIENGIKTTPQASGWQFAGLKSYEEAFDAANPSIRVRKEFSHKGMFLSDGAYGATFPTYFNFRPDVLKAEMGHGYSGPRYMILKVEAGSRPYTAMVAADDSSTPGIAGELAYILVDGNSSGVLDAQIKMFNRQPSSTQATLPSTTVQVLKTGMDVTSNFIPSPPLYETKYKFYYDRFVARISANEGIWLQNESPSTLTSDGGTCNALICCSIVGGNPPSIAANAHNVVLIGTRFGAKNVPSPVDQDYTTVVQRFRPTGGIQFSVRSIFADDSVGLDDYMIICGNPSTFTTITLPATPVDGQSYIFKIVIPASLPVALDPGTHAIDGVFGTYIISTGLNSVVQLIWASGWQIVSKI